MRIRPKKRQSGFSLLEMTIASAVGTVVMGAALSVYVQGVNATWTVTQRAEMQEDFRAASNILKNDLSLAGAGMGNGASIVLPTSATVPVYGCSQVTSTCYIAGASVAYPVTGGSPYLYGLVPGYTKGPVVNTMATDIVTVVYTDPIFALNCYTATLTNSTTVTFALPGTLTCTLPTSIATPQSINDAGVGLTVGDLIWFNLNNTNVVAEVTTVSGSTISFAAGDQLKMNQAAATHNLASITTGTTGTGQRLEVITYYIDTTTTPSRLMRQVSGHTPMPVAENVVYLQFTYDVFNYATNAAAVGCPNPGAATACATGSSTGLLPNQITKINVAHMDMDSTMYGAQYGGGGGYQRIDLQTSVSARNLTYINDYPQ